MIRWAEPSFSPTPGKLGLDYDLVYLPLAGEPLSLACGATRFVPDDPSARTQTHAWLMYQMSTVGPYLGQRVHFLLDSPEPMEYAVGR